MVQLFLSRPSSGGSGGAAALKDRVSLLHSLESVIWSVITSGGRYEPRLWLCNTVACIRSIDHRDQRKLFRGILASKRSKRDVAAQLLRMIFDMCPQKAGAILARKCRILEKFFDGHPRRILQWFDHFAGTGEFGHKKGARAICQFAFVNRDICWEELEWKGRHGQSPAVVATKPHYFHDLDVLRTMENFLEYVPEFWSSDELAESVKDGEILHIDTEFFVDQFIHLMYEENMEDVWAMIDKFLVEQQFSSLCQRLLILLNEHELRAFLDSICNCISARQYVEDFGCSSSWLEILLSSNIEHVTVDDFILLNAVINQGRQILLLLGDDEHEVERQVVEGLLKTITNFGSADHWHLMMEDTKIEFLVAIKWICLQSWILHYVLSKECKTKEYWEALFVENGISFKRSGDYSLISSNGVFEGSRSDSDDEDSFGDGNRKRKRSRKKQKRGKYDNSKSDMNELIDFDVSDARQDSQLGSGRWLLSMDGFSCPWNMDICYDLLDSNGIPSYPMWLSVAATASSATAADGGIAGATVLASAVGYKAVGVPTWLQVLPNRFGASGKEQVWGDGAAPACIFQFVELYALHSGALLRCFGNDCGEAFMFTCRDRKYAKGERPSRTASGGYWKDTAAGTIITNDSEKEEGKYTQARCEDQLAYARVHH